MILPDSLLWYVSSLLGCCLITHSWYHGKISRENSEDRLKSVNCDCFLIRESENRPGKFSLSLTHKGKVKHFRIDTKRGARRRFELFGVKRSFLQLGSLVEYYNQHCISAHGELLITPCPLEVRSTFFIKINLQ